MTLLALVAVLSWPAESRASGAPDGPIIEVLFLGFVATPVVINATFTTYDIVVAGRGELPDRELAKGELLISGGMLALLSLPLTSAASSAARGEADTLEWIGLGYGAWTLGLATHGLWGVLVDRDSGDPPQHALRKPASAPEFRLEGVGFVALPPADSSNTGTAWLGAHGTF